MGKSYNTFAFSDQNFAELYAQFDPPRTWNSSVLSTSNPSGWAIAYASRSQNTSPQQIPTGHCGRLSRCMTLTELWLSLPSTRQRSVRVPAAIGCSINFVPRRPAALGHRASNRFCFSPGAIDGLATRRPRPSCWPPSKTSSQPPRPANDAARSFALVMQSKKRLSRASTRPASWGPLRMNLNTTGTVVRSPERLPRGIQRPLNGSRNRCAEMPGLWTAKICQEMAMADPSRAERLARTSPEPVYRAYALGCVAVAVAPKDRATARRLIEEAYEILQQCVDTGNRGSRVVQKPTGIAFGLLELVEQIDPTLIREFFCARISLPVQHDFRQRIDVIGSLWRRRSHAAVRSGPRRILRAI